VEYPEGSITRNALNLIKLQRLGQVIDAAMVDGTCVQTSGSGALRGRGAVPNPSASSAGALLAL